MSAVGGRNTNLSAPLIGSITVLVLLLGTFLAYNANRGLPWVPSKLITVEVKDAANIVPGNEVRIGGTRVGIVANQKARRYPDGRVTALLELKLDQTTQPIPVDTTVLIRARSLLGLKYVELTRGKDKRTFAWGSRVPLKNATPDPVEIDQLLNTFDDRTRTGISQFVTAFGDILAGRGAVIAQLIDDAEPLARNLVPVAKVLADRDNGFVALLDSISRFTGELAAAGDATGGLFRGLNGTAAGIADADAAFDETLRTAPEAFQATAQALQTTRANLAPQVNFARRLRPSIANIARGAGDLAGATSAANRALADTPRFARDFGALLTQLDATTKDPIVSRGLDGITAFDQSAEPLVKSLAAAQLRCSYGSLLFRGLASATSGGNSVGNWLSVNPYLAQYSLNGSAGPAATPQNGMTLPAGARAEANASDRVTRNRNAERNAYLTTNRVSETGQNGVCQPGYEVRTDYASVTGNLSLSTSATTLRKPYFRPAPPKGSPFRPKTLDAKTTEDSDE